MHQSGATFGESVRVAVWHKEFYRWSFLSLRECGAVTDVWKKLSSDFRDTTSEWTRCILQLFLSLETRLRLLIDRGNPLSQTKIKDLKE